MGCGGREDDHACESREGVMSTFRPESPPVRGDGRPVRLRSAARPRIGRAAPALRPGTGRRPCRALRSVGLRQDLAWRILLVRGARCRIGTPDISRDARGRADRLSRGRTPEQARGRPPIAASLRRLPEAAAGSRREGSGRTLLVVDEAHPDRRPGFTLLKSCAPLQNFASRGSPDLMLLLVGGPELLLRMPTSLADRLTAHCLLGPLPEEETGAYIHGRLAAAGAASTLFSPDSLTAAFIARVRGCPAAESPGRFRPSGGLRRGTGAAGPPLCGDRGPRA